MPYFSGSVAAVSAGPVAYKVPSATTSSRYSSYRPGGSLERTYGSYSSSYLGRSSGSSTTSSYATEYRSRFTSPASPAEPVVATHPTPPQPPGTRAPARPPAFRPPSKLPADPDPLHLLPAPRPPPPHPPPPHPPPPRRRTRPLFRLPAIPEEGVFGSSRSKPPPSSPPPIPPSLPAAGSRTSSVASYSRSSSLSEEASRLSLGSRERGDSRRLTSPGLSTADIISKYSPATYQGGSAASDLGRPPLASRASAALVEEKEPAAGRTVRGRASGLLSGSTPARTAAGSSAGAASSLERRSRVAKEVNGRAPALPTASHSSNNNNNNSDSESTSSSLSRDDDNGNGTPPRVAEIRRRFDASTAVTIAGHGGSRRAAPGSPDAAAAPAPAPVVRADSEDETSSSSSDEDEEEEEESGGMSEPRRRPPERAVNEVSTGGAGSVERRTVAYGSRPSAVPAPAAAGGAASGAYGRTSRGSAQSQRIGCGTSNNGFVIPRSQTNFSDVSSVSAHASLLDSLSLESLEDSSVLGSSPQFGRSSVRYERGGLSGLRNIGNTCFMNSVIQCLSNTRPLLEYLLSESYLSDINCNVSNMKGALIKAFSSVIHELWREDDGTVNTTQLKSQIQRFAPRFMGYSQQDAQEFLRYLLEGLHEDVNRITSKPKPISTEIDDKLSDQQKAMESWKRYLRMDDSKVVDIFVGQLKSTLRCTVCGHCSVTFDPFWDLSLPIPSRTGQVRLQQCLDSFTREEVLDGDEKPTCARCQTRRKCTKSLTIQKFPKIMVLHLKRFSPNERFRGKLSVTVDFPLTGLDLSAYAASRGQGCIYNLYAVSNHSGTTYSGHYTAYCRHPYSGEWHEYNDSRVSTISTRSVVSSEAYVLFYELSGHSSHL